MAYKDDYCESCGHDVLIKWQEGKAWKSRCKKCSVEITIAVKYETVI